MRPITFIPGLAALSIAALLVLFSGCEEMPELAADSRPAEPVITAGPYVLLDDQTTPYTVRFRTNVPCVAGLRTSAVQKTTQRFGGNQTNHGIDITRLLPPKGEAAFEILLDDFRRAQIRAYTAAPGSPAQILFLGGDAAGLALPTPAGAGAPAHPLTPLAQRLALQKANAAVLTGGLHPAGSKLAEWDAGLFNPLRPLTEVCPLFLLPEDRRLAPAEAAPALAAPYYSYNLGSVHLVFLDLSTLKSPATRTPALAWLQKDLALNTRPWCVLTLSEPLFGPTKIYARAVEALGTLLETGGVDLVVSNDAGGYFRSLPVRAGESGVIRYIVTGGLTGGKAAAAGREYRAASSGEPHYATLSATPDQLEWKAYSPATGALVDSLTVFPDGSSAQGEPAVEKMDILTDALSTITLQREVLTVAREAARAVSDPAAPQNLRFIVANPSPREIKGELVWNVSAAGAYKIEPAGVQFELKSGFEGVVDFAVTPYAKDPAAPMPELVVNMRGVGSARQQLILAKRKKAAFYPPLAPLTIDGMMEEEGWTTAAALEGFGVIGGGGAPKQPVEARLCYDSQGVYLAVRCAAKDAATIATRAVNHDDPVYRDESVEFFFDPRNHGREYFQFAVNVKGVTLDRSSQLGLAWNPRWESLVTRGGNSYTVEVFIPYQALGLPGAPAPGTRWGINVCRNDGTEGAVHEPFGASAPAKSGPDAGLSSGRVNRYNIGKLAAMDLSKEKASAKTPAPEAAPAPGKTTQIVQWADTFGSNARSGLYGELTFEAARPVPAAPGSPAASPASAPVAPAAPVAPVAPAGASR